MLVLALSHTSVDEVYSVPLDSMELRSFNEAFSLRCGSTSAPPQEPPVPGDELMALLGVGSGRSFVTPAPVDEEEECVTSLLAERSLVTCSRSLSLEPLQGFMEDEGAEEDGAGDILDVFSAATDDVDSIVIVIDAFRLRFHRHGHRHRHTRHISTQHHNMDECCRWSAIANTCTHTHLAAFACGVSFLPSFFFLAFLRLSRICDAKQAR